LTLRIGLGGSCALPGRLALPATLGILAAGRAGDFPVDLVGEVFQLPLRSPEGRRVIAQDALRGAVDALAELLDALAGVPGGLGGLPGDTDVDQLLRR